MTDDLVTRLRAGRVTGMGFCRVKDRLDLEAAAEITRLNAVIAAKDEALSDIASIDRPFVAANGTDGAFEKIIARAQEALSREADQIGSDDEGHIAAERFALRSRAKGLSQ